MIKACIFFYSKFLIIKSHLNKAYRNLLKFVSCETQNKLFFMKMKKDFNKVHIMSLNRVKINSLLIFSQQDNPAQFGDLEKRVSIIDYLKW